MRNKFEQERWPESTEPEEGAFEGGKVARVESLNHVTLSKAGFVKVVGFDMSESKGDETELIGGVVGGNGMKGGGNQGLLLPDPLGEVNLH